jgi:hypothetical protein
MDSLSSSINLPQNMSLSLTSSKRDNKRQSISETERRLNDMIMELSCLRDKLIGEKEEKSKPKVNQLFFIK